MKKMGKEFFTSKVFVAFSLFILFGAISVLAGNVIVNEYGVQSENYYSKSGNDGATFNLSVVGTDGNNYTLIFENGLVVEKPISSNSSNESGDGGEQNQSYNGTWWDESWNKKKQIQISNVSSDVNINYSILLTISYDSDMQSNFNDLRFINNNEDTELPYWIENKSDGSFANVWVRLDLDTLEDTIIYLYYGNSEASSNSDIKGAFLLGDDFDDSSINTSLWQIGSGGSGSISEGGGVLNITSSTTVSDYAYIRSINLYGVDTVATFKINTSVTGTPVLHIGYGGCDGSAPHICSGSDFFTDIVYWNGPYGLRNRESGASSSIVSMTSSFNKWDTYKIYRLDSVSKATNLEGSVTSSDYYPTGNLKITAGVERGGSFKIDYVFVRPFDTFDPEYSFYSEQSYN